MLRDRDQILARVDLEALADRLIGPRPRGTGLWACPNPGHEQTGRTPPLSVFRDRRGGQRWCCHGCGDGGTAIDLVMATGRARDVPGALDYLSGDPGLPAVPRTRPAQAPKTPRPVTPPTAALGRYTRGCAAHLHSGPGRPVWAWLTEHRAIPARIIDHVGLGADPGPRHLARPDGVPKVFPAVVFPVRDDAGDVVFTLSRHLRPVASRWWNTADRAAPNPRVAFYTPPGPTPTCTIVTEGPLDALSALAAGYPAAALIGAAGLSDTAADKLAAKGHPLLLALDNDAFGRAATTQLGQMLDQRGASWARLDIPARHGDLNDWHRLNQRRWPQVLRASAALSACVGPCADLPPSVA